MSTSGHLQLTYSVSEVAIHLGGSVSAANSLHNRAPQLSTFSPVPSAAPATAAISQEYRCSSRQYGPVSAEPGHRSSARSAATAGVAMTTSSGRRVVDSVPDSAGGDMGIRRGTVMEKVANVFCGGSTPQSSVTSYVNTSPTVKNCSNLSPKSSPTKEKGQDRALPVSPVLLRRDVNAKTVLKKEKPPVPPRDRSTICRSRQADDKGGIGKGSIMNSTIPSSNSITSKHCASSVNESNQSSVIATSNISNASSSPNLPQTASVSVLRAVTTTATATTPGDGPRPPPPPQRHKPVPPEKPSRFSFQKMFAGQQAIVSGAARGVYSGVSSAVPFASSGGSRSPRVWRKQVLSSQTPLPTNSVATNASARSRFQPPKFTCWRDLWLQDTFLDTFFQCALPNLSRTFRCANSRRLLADQLEYELNETGDDETVFAVCRLAQVCRTWRDLLYRRPQYWYHLCLHVRCHDIRSSAPNGDVNAARAQLFGSLQSRLCDSIRLTGAQDEDLRQLPLHFAASTRCLHSLQLVAGRFSDRALEQLLRQLAALTSLRVSGCNEVSDAALWSGLQPRLARLTVTDCINVSDDSVAAVAQLLPALEELNLQAYHVTDTALTYFTHKSSANCQVLRLRSCWELTNHAALNIAGSLPNLRVLSLSGCSKITDEGIEIIAENIKGLQSLNVSWCMRVTDTALEVIACDLAQLQELILDRCMHVSDRGVGYLVQLAALKTLSVRWCCQLHDTGLHSVCSIEQLRILRLAGCTQLSAEALSSLSQLRHLLELELTNCPAATDELHSYLQQKLPQCTIYS